MRSSPKSSGYWKTGNQCQKAFPLIQRKNSEIRVVALQPGTVVSSLSKEFIHSSTPCVLVEESVAGMLNALHNCPLQKGAQFLDYKGQSIPW